ncbi:MAG TPA: hypothetical protein VII45_04055 [Solirubrobacterales bacterium]
MKSIRTRLTYANVMSSIAVFLVLGGATAFAASKITAKQLQSNSVTTAKIKKNAVTASKIKNNSVTTGKLADSAVTTGKIADSAVSTGKLAEAERSQVFASTATSSFDFVDTYNPETWTTVMSLNLPAGNWVVSANVGLVIAGSKTHIGCRLNQGGKVLSQSGSEGEIIGGLIPSVDGISLAGVAGAGQVTVTCGDNNDGTTSVSRSLIATRAGSISAG